ncbi:methyltransferase type 11 [Candidatus Curtissbacteria bacterium RBG_13_35_7]|uniref:Methyltransferase type 11 n=1 Tax=Candidatus Curtissbacteria bacterium RBG_13_35_7 TaxID=1797705 RepID=A0A1F5G2K1_9BACT|nr:MAG: methyltransferase type 11 [Candidatus Curtissbacteria bacterium RBG_13_35_7]
MLPNKKEKNSTVQVPTSHYFGLNYTSKERWISYWYQIDEIIKLKPQSVLEIGVGNKTVSDYLKKLGIKITTCDLDTSLKPDVIADVTNLPFKKESFDVVICAQVLEHLPFKDFSKALKELYRVTKKSVVITLPHFSITDLYFGIKLIPYIPQKEFSFKVDLPIKHEFLGEHYWEIGKKNYPLKKIKHEIVKSGFKIEKSYYPKENPFHHFFVLQK